MPAISFSNIGELVIAKMFQAKPQNLLPILELGENDIDYAHIAEIPQFAFAETTIVHDQGYGFDPNAQGGCRSLDPTQCGLCFGIKTR